MTTIQSLTTLVAQKTTTTMTETMSNIKSPCDMSDADCFGPFRSWTLEEFNAQTALLPKNTPVYACDYGVVDYPLNGESILPQEVFDSVVALSRISQESNHTYLNIGIEPLIDGEFVQPWSIDRLRTRLHARCIDNSSPIDRLTSVALFRNPQFSVRFFNKETVEAIWPDHFNRPILMKDFVLLTSKAKY